MRIAYLINQYPKTSHAFIRREIRALEEAGISVSRFTIRRTRETLADPEDREELARTRALLDAGAVRIAGVTLATALARPMRFLKALRMAFTLARNSSRSLAVHLIYLAEACLLRQWLAREGVNHLHVHFGTNSAAVGLLCRLLGGRGGRGGRTYSFTVHGPEEFDHPSELSLPAKMAGADVVIAISDFGRSQLYRWCPQEQWDKIHVVHCGVDEAMLAAPATPVPVRPRLVCVGRLCEQKGQFLLIEAARQMAAACIACELVLVGDGPMRGEIEHLIQRHGLERSVRITGWASGAQVQAEIRAARALVLPSFAEGLPVVIMEALALGRPVISTWVAGIPELVEPGINGWLVSPGNVEALVGAMKEALSLPVERLAEMGQAGARRVRERHDARIEAGKLAELFRRAISQQVDAAESDKVVPPLEQTPVALGAPRA